MAQAEPPRSWSDLPTELADTGALGLTVSALGLYADTGASPQSSIACPGGKFFSLLHSESFQFHDSASFYSSCCEWLVFSHDDTCYLKNPFSKITLTLPNLSCVRPIDEPVEIINGPVTQEGQMPPASLNMDAEMSIQKLVMCSELLVAAIVNMGALHTIALCRPGADSWLVSALCSNEPLTYMIFFGGKLYAINEFRDLFAIDLVDENDSGKLSISQVERLVVGRPFTYRLISGGATNINYFLVESRGALLLVDRTIFGIMPSPSDEEEVSIEPVGIEFKVFKADFNSPQWVVMTSVGDDQVLFLGKSYSQSVCVSEYKLQGNRIFILDDGTCNWLWADMTSPYLIYNMSDGKLYSPSSPKTAGTLKGEKAPSTWLFPL